MEENQEREKIFKVTKVTKDYRVFILLKYIYIGCADICFWWTVWNIADHLWPMDITTDGALSYLRGYALIIGANLYYLLFRLASNELCQKFYESRVKLIYPAVIVTEEEVIKNKPIKFKLLKLVFPTFVYILVVGFIQIWRGLFATFDYIVLILYERYGVNQVLSSIFLQLVVCVTLAFTQKNNAVNLCPTHKIYKYDVLEELDGLFNLHIFKNFTKQGKFQTKITEAAYPSSDSNENHAIQNDPNKVPGKKVSFSPLDHEFDIVQYAAHRISISIHRTSISSNASSETNVSRKLCEVSNKLSKTSSSKLSAQEISQKRRKNLATKETSLNGVLTSMPASNTNNNNTRSRKISRQENFFGNAFAMNSTDEHHQVKPNQDSSRKVSAIITVIKGNEGTTSITSSQDDGTGNNNTITISEEIYENEHATNQRIEIVESVDSSLEEENPQSKEYIKISEPSGYDFQEYSESVVESSEEICETAFKKSMESEDNSSKVKNVQPTEETEDSLENEVVAEPTDCSKKEDTQPKGDTLPTKDAIKGSSPEDLDEFQEKVEYESSSISIPLETTDYQTTEVFLTSEKFHPSSPTIKDSNKEKKKDSLTTEDALNIITSTILVTEVKDSSATEDQMSRKEDFFDVAQDDVLFLGEETCNGGISIEYQNKHFANDSMFCDVEPSNDHNLHPQIHNDTFLGLLHRRTSIDLTNIREVYDSHSISGIHQATASRRGSIGARGDHEGCEKCFVCRLVKIIAYSYTIHHRQIFLHIFGGMFWSTTWKLFDFATESFFTKTASDVPGLAFIAMFCHCINHLVLFRFKETASSIHWKTFWESFCGFFTVCLWAPVWYIFDIIAEATGEKLIFQIVANLVSFGSLAALGISINTAL